MSAINTAAINTVAAAPLPILSRIAGLPAAIGDYLRLRRGLAELRSLSPEMLKDIGIEASQIERYARFGR